MNRIRGCTIGIFWGLSILVLLSTFSTAALAQDRDVATSDTVLVQLVDNSTVLGVVVELTDAHVSIRTKEGLLITIPRDQIVSIVHAATRKYRQMDPNISRLLFGPTARALGSGNGYMALYEIFFSFVGVGAGDNVNLAGGISLFPGVSDQILYAAPKITFYEENDVSVAGGVLAGKGTWGAGSAGLVYGVTTIGPTSSAFTAGLAYGFVDGEFGKNPVLMLGAETQVSEQVKLITENYVIVGSSVIVSGGFRGIGTRFAFDVAFFTSLDAFGEGGFPLIPWLGVAYNFGE